MLSTVRPRVSVVVPAKDEAENLPALLAEIEAALSGAAFEVIVVDDGSDDGTQDLLGRLASRHPTLRAVIHDRSCGKSAAILSGVRAARGEVVVTVDGDGQNDPRHILPLAALLDEEGVGLAAGQRVRHAHSSAKRLASKLANGLRARLLKDSTRDTACGLKAFPRDLFLRLPYFDTMHRFLPALVLREGHAVRHLDVVDRPRLHGRSKYGLIDRGLVGALDLFGVWWLRRRRRQLAEARELESLHV